RTLEFNDAHVDRFIKEFRSTIAIAKLEASDTVPSAGESDEGENDHDDVQPHEKENRQHRRRPVQAGFTEDVLNLPDEGQIVIQMPKSLSPAGFEDFESWLQLIIRKA